MSSNFSAFFLLLSYVSLLAACGQIELPLRVVAPAADAFNLVYSCRSSWCICLLFYKAMCRVNRNPNGLRLYRLTKVIAYVCGKRLLPAPKRA